MSLGAWEISRKVPFLDLSSARLQDRLEEQGGNQSVVAAGVGDQGAPT